MFLCLESVVVPISQIEINFTEVQTKLRSTKLTEDAAISLLMNLDPSQTDEDNLDRYE